MKAPKCIVIGLPPTWRNCRKERYSKIPILVRSSLISSLLGVYAGSENYLTASASQLKTKASVTRVSTKNEL